MENERLIRTIRCSIDARDRGLACNRCGYSDRRNRNGKVFRCLKCGYGANADFNAAVNIGRAAIPAGYTPSGKELGAIGRQRRGSRNPRKPIYTKPPMRDG